MKKQDSIEELGRLLAQKSRKLRELRKQLQAADAAPCAMCQAHSAARTAAEHERDEAQAELRASNDVQEGLYRQLNQLQTQLQNKQSECDEARTAAERQTQRANDAQRPANEQIARLTEQVKELETQLRVEQGLVRSSQAERDDLQAKLDKQKTEFRKLYDHIESAFVKKIFGQVSYAEVQQLMKINREELDKIVGDKT